MILLGILVPLVLVLLRYLWRKFVVNYRPVFEGPPPEFFLPTPIQEEKRKKSIEKRVQKLQEDQEREQKEGELRIKYAEKNGFLSIFDLEMEWHNAEMEFERTNPPIPKMRSMQIANEQALQNYMEQQLRRKFALAKIKEDIFAPVFGKTGESSSESELAADLADLKTTVRRIRGCDCASRTKMSQKNV